MKGGRKVRRKERKEDASRNSTPEAKVLLASVGMAELNLKLKEETERERERSHRKTAIRERISTRPTIYHASNYSVLPLDPLPSTVRAHGTKNKMGRGPETLGYRSFKRNTGEGAVFDQ